VSTPILTSKNRLWLTNNPMPLLTNKIGLLLTSKIGLLVNADFCHRRLMSRRKGKASSPILISKIRY